MKWIHNHIADSVSLRYLYEYTSIKIPCKGRTAENAENFPIGVIIVLYYSFKVRGMYGFALLANTR